jgi:hypothetical protein
LIQLQIPRHDTALSMIYLVYYVINALSQSVERITRERDSGERKGRGWPWRPACEGRPADGQRPLRNSEQATRVDMKKQNGISQFNLKNITFGEINDIRLRLAVQSQNVVYTLKCPSLPAPCRTLLHLVFLVLLIQSYSRSHCLFRRSKRRTTLPKQTFRIPSPVKPTPPSLGLLPLVQVTVSTISLTPPLILLLSSSSNSSSASFAPSSLPT